MKIGTARVGTLVWALIYGGLFVAVCGFAVQRGGDGWGWGMFAAGLVCAALGVVLIVVLSRMRAPAPAGGEAPLQPPLNEGKHS